jgi:predicted small lipoprotein YifL
MRFVIALSLILSLAGCGQRGPLYLPDDPEQTPVDAPGDPVTALPPETPEAAEAEAEDDTDDDDDDEEDEEDGAGPQP